MAYTVNDVEKLYRIKCRKYKQEQLTERLKSILLEEAATECCMMNAINSGVVIAD